MRSSSPRCSPCRSAMTAAICKGTPGPAAGLTSRTRCSQLKGPTRSSTWQEPPSRKKPWASPAPSTGVKAATIGMTACAPSTLARRRSMVSIGNRPLTFGVISTTPTSAAWVSDGPNESNGRTSSDLRVRTPRTTVTPSATPITLNDVLRQSAANAARWMRRKDTHPVRSLRITVSRRPQRRRRRAHVRRRGAVRASRTAPRPGRVSP